MTLTLHILRARLVERGVWCDHCLLPSAARVELLLRLGEDGKPYYHIGRMCAGCNTQEQA